MAQRIPCPGCGRWLRIPGGIAEPWLTCPKCLAQLPNPAAVTPAAGVQAGPSPPTPAFCPKCGEAVEASWRYCPACHEDLRQPAVWGFGAATDSDVRRDQWGTSVSLILLAVFGGLGLIYVGIHSDRGRFLGLTLLALLFVLVAYNNVYNQRQPPTGARGMAQVVVRTLAGFGCLFGIWLLVSLAALIVLFIVCSQIEHVR
jgi:hypothetical protein